MQGCYATTLLLGKITLHSQRYISFTSPLLAWVGLDPKVLLPFSCYLLLAS